MEIGIIGLPLSGKTTVFNAITRSNAQTGGYASGRIQVQTAVVDVPDPRVDVLSRLFRPRKTVYAKTQFNDVTGVAAASQRQDAARQQHARPGSLPRSPRIPHGSVSRGPF